jgi:hypothetical protein
MDDVISGNHHADPKVIRERRAHDVGGRCRPKTRSTVRQVVLDI